MYVIDHYVGSKYTTYIKKAYFKPSSFHYIDYDRFKRNPDLFQRSLVKIDHLERDPMGREIILYLDLDGKIVKHYEPSINLKYDSLQLNDDFQIIGATIWNWSGYPSEEQEYLFQY